MQANKNAKSSDVYRYMKRQDEIEKVKKYQKQLQTKFLNNTKMMIQFQLMAPAIQKIKSKLVDSAQFDKNDRYKQFQDQNV